MGMTAGNQYELSYVSRILLGTVGTAQIPPPLPIRKRRPLWTAFSFGRNTFPVPGRLTKVTYFAQNVACRLHIG